MKQFFKDFLKKESQPMRQSTYWIIYISSALVFVIKTVEASALASYELILIHPELASHSTIVNLMNF